MASPGRRWRMLVQAALWSVSFLLPTLPAQSDLSGRISGRIVDALGEGVPAAEVRLLAGDKVRARTRADGEGMYVFGHISWAAAARGLLPLELRAVSPGKLEASAPVHVDLTQDHFVADLRLFDAARLTVRVVNDAGAKVAGARVHVARSSYSNESPKSPILMERSDAGGRAVFERAPVGHLTVFAHAEGHILGCRKMWLTKSTETTMSLKRGRGAVFELRIPGVPDDATTQIKLVLPKRPGVGAGLDFGVMRGPRHVIAGIPNEPAAFVLWRRGVGRTRLPLRMALGDGPAARALLVPAARTEDPVVATFKPWPGALRQLEAPRNVVRGVVLDPEGKPLAGIHVVELFGNEVAVTDADGAFACKTPATRAFLRLSGTDLTFYTPGQPLGMNAPSVIAKDSARVYHGVALVDARSKTVHRLRTMRGASLRGRVLDRDGHPRRGAS